MGAYATFEMKVTYNIVAHSLFDRFPQFAAFILTMYKYAFKTYYNAILCFTSFPKKNNENPFFKSQACGGDCNGCQFDVTLILFFPLSFLRAYCSKESSQEQIIPGLRTHLSTGAIQTFGENLGDSGPFWQEA